MPCTGDLILGRITHFQVICQYLSPFFWVDVFVCVFSRLLVSASQDGKLIIWDSYTTNKVGLFFLFFFLRE